MADTNHKCVGPRGNAVKDFCESPGNRLKTLKALYIKAWVKLFATANNATPGLE
jgi:hypothetical protein